MRKQNNLIKIISRGTKMELARRIKKVDLYKMPIILIKARPEIISVVLCRCV